jgi:glutamate synthase domain-containing protein 3
MRSRTIDAKNMHYTPLNRKIRELVKEGVQEIILENVLGQRFIADGLKGKVTIHIHGVPGGDLGMFMSGPTCIVHGNCEHAPGNTMDGGKIIIHGSAGDTIAHSMRGGKIFVRDNIGYRGGIHMKEYGDHYTTLVVGGTAQSFLGEYMAGGRIIVLGSERPKSVDGRGVGSGIHGGEIIIRGNVEENQLGVGAKIETFSTEDLESIKPLLLEFCEFFNIAPKKYLDTNYTRIVPSSSRPFAGKYTWE